MTECDNRKPIKRLEGGLASGFGAHAPGVHPALEARVPIKLDVTGLSVWMDWCPPEKLRERNESGYRGRGEGE